MKRMDAIRWVMLLAGCQLPLLGMELLGAFQADISTSPPGTQRLFLSAGVPAPVGTPIWIVADRSKDGLFQGTEVLPEVIQEMEAGAGDNVRFWADTVDGFALGDQAGVYQRAGVDVPDAGFAQAHIYVLVWNDANADGTIGNEGDTFGALDLGVQPPSGFGNAEYSIGSDILADQFRVSGNTQPTNTTVTFVSWVSSAFPENTPDQDRLPAADPDGDSLVNELEYLLGTDPMQKDANAIRREVTQDATGITLSLEVTVRKDRQDAGLQAGASPDLVTWTPVAEEVVSETTDARTLRFVLPGASAGQGFLKLNVVPKP